MTAALPLKFVPIIVGLYTVYMTAGNEGLKEKKDL